MSKKFFKKKIGRIIASLTLTFILVLNLFTITSMADSSTQRYLMYATWTWSASDSLDTFKTLVDTAKSAGFNAVKLHIPWYVVESAPGVYDYSIFDQQIGYAANTKDMKVAIHIDLTRQSTTDNVVPTQDFQCDSSGTVLNGYMNRKMISFASDTAVDKASNFVKLITSRYYSSYSAKILFFETTFDPVCEAEYFFTGGYDYSNIAKAKFTAWLSQKYASISALNADWGTSYVAFDNVQPPSNYNGASGLSWYQFRHSSLKNIIDRMADAVHNVSSAIKYSVRFGSVWDDNIKERGNVAFPDLCTKADIVFVDDAPTYDHNWSMDVLRGSLPGKEIGNEIDGPNSADNATYYNQAQQSYNHGAKYITVANWQDNAVFQSRMSLFTDIAANLLPYPVPTGDPNRAHININAYDMLMNGYTYYKDLYNKLSSNGALWVDGYLDDNISMRTNTAITSSNTASSSFSSTQGQNQWYYQEWNGSNYSNMTWDSGSSWWKGSQACVIVASDWQHPDSNDSVRKWVANSTGKLAITGNINGISSLSDGVTLKIIKNSSLIWGPVTTTANDIYGIEHNVQTTVNAGDSIYFIVNKNGNNGYDTTTWNPTISYLQAPKFTWTASTDFGSTQGQNQWYYQEWNGSSYVNMAWIGANSWWKGSQNSVLIGSNWQHPDTNDSARKWVANNPGKITITGNAKVTSSLSDGVTVKIMKNSSLIWGPFTINTSGYGHNFPITVNAGDAIYFVVNKNGNNGYDTTEWDPTITFTPCMPSTWTASQGFSSVQGQNQWYYQQWNGSSYSNMTWDAGNIRWKGSQASVLVFSNKQHPDTYDSVRKWVAPEGCNISIKGIAKKEAAGGDGVLVKIIKNGTVIWGPQTISSSNLTGIAHDVDTSMNAGDAIYFVVNKNGNNSYDSTLWDTKITITNNR